MIYYNYYFEIMISGTRSILNRLLVVDKFKTFLKKKDVTYCKFSSIKREANVEKYEDNENSSIEKPVSSKQYKKKIIRLDFSDTNLSDIMLQVKSKKLRKKSNLFYFEGKRLLRDALNAGIVPLCIYFSRRDDISDFQFPEETKLFKVPYNDLKLWSDLTTCPGILAICRRANTEIEDYDPLIPVSVICDNVREPGNLGSILRSAAGAGVKNVILSEGCCDLWDPKVLRGAMGAHFRIPIHYEVNWEALGQSINKETLILVATNEEKRSSLIEEQNKVVPYYSISYERYKDIALIIGGETEGVSSHSYNLAKTFDYCKITIPLCNFVESLNNVSALSVILYEIKRQFEIKGLSEGSTPTSPEN